MLMLRTSSYGNPSIPSRLQMCLRLRVAVPLKDHGLISYALKALFLGIPFIYGFCVWIGYLHSIDSLALLVYPKVFVAFVGIVRILGSTCAFECILTEALADYWASMCNRSWQRRWEQLLEWLQGFKGNILLHIIIRCSFAALTYIVWQDRNDIIFRGKSANLLAMQNKLWRMVQEMAYGWGSFSSNEVNIRIQRAWGLHQSLIN